MALIPCKVRSEVGGNLWVVRFPGHPGKSLALQSDWDQHTFAQACGKGTPDTTPVSDPLFTDLDPETITQCPDDYLAVTQTDPPGRFRPEGHPLADVCECPECGSGSVSLPEHPGDYFDCDSCGHSWPMNRHETARMNRTPEENREYVDAMAAGYLECALFTADEELIPPKSGEFDASPYLPRCPARLKAECRRICEAFYRARAADLSEWEGEQAGRDIWYCRNGHGAGFWDRDFGTKEQREALSAAARKLGEANLYRGRGGWFAIEGRGH